MSPLIRRQLQANHGQDVKNVQTITATPRQLESLIRISESLARMRLSRTVERSDAAEALRLMQASSAHLTHLPLKNGQHYDVLITLLWQRCELD